MSHVATIEVEIQNLKCLKSAVKRLGLVWKENQKNYKWFGRHVGDYPMPDGMTTNDLGKCIHAIGVPGAEYEVGVIRDPMNKKNYKLIWDFWDKRLLNKLGPNAWKLSQAVAIEQGKYAAKLKGFTCKEEVMDDRVRLVVYA
jgi:hypothetical protein